MLGKEGEDYPREKRSAPVTQQFLRQQVGAEGGEDKTAEGGEGQGGGLPKDQQEGQGQQGIGRRVGVKGERGLCSREEQLG